MATNARRLIGVNLTLAVLVLACGAEQKTQQNKPPPPVQEVVLIVHGMTCSACNEAIEKSVSQLPGVTSVQADFQSGQVHIQTAAEFDLAAAQQAIEQLGYRPVGLPDKNPESNTAAQPADSLLPGTAIKM